VPSPARVLAAAGFALLASTRADLAATQDPSGVAAAVARPLKPAAVALLLPHIAQPAAQARLIEALRDADPEVRAVAARIAFVTGLPALTAPLASALEQEQNALAGAEMVRAASVVAAPSLDDALLAIARRIGGTAPTAWLEVVSRVRPLDILPRLDKLGNYAGEALVPLATAQPDAVAKAFATLPSNRALEEAFLDMLAEAGDARAPLPAAVLAPGLEAKGAPRRAVVHHVLRRLAKGLAVSADAEAAVRAVTQSIAVDEDPYLALIAELTRRPAASPVALGPAIAALDAAAGPTSVWSDSWLRRLDAREEAALRERLGDRLPARDLWDPDAPPRPSELESPAQTGALSTIRMIRPLTASIVRDIAAATGCKPGANQTLAVELGYRPTGQVRQVFPPVGQGAARCGDAARLLAALDVPRQFESIAADRTDLIVIGFRPEDMACARTDPRTKVPPARAGQRFVMPTLVRRVPPVYPAALEGRRVSGVVLVDATIAASGCIAEAMVIRHQHPNPNFDVAALEAVSAWLFTPGTKDGQIVPVRVTVEVAFRP